MTESESYLHYALVDNERRLTITGNRRGLLELIQALKNVLEYGGAESMQNAEPLDQRAAVLLRVIEIRLVAK